jgi:hypothetical protein
MSLLFVTLGEDQETMYHDVLSLLKYTIINSVSMEVKNTVSKNEIVFCSFLNLIINYITFS